MCISQENGSPHWYVMRAYKCERQAEERLSGKDGLEHFIPKQYAVRVYHGVKSKRLVPVIPGLVFVYATQEQIVTFKKQYNFLQFVMRKRDNIQDYLIVPNDQMNDFIKVVSVYQENTTFYSPEEIDIKKGTKVRIHGGKLDGVKGVFMQVKGKRNRRVVILLEGIVAVAAEVHPDLVEVME